ncbi:PREDICTED: uncharacterized protein LOC109591431 [Amphimedon queenslandica]|uniref:Death domain-containing protein n=1 Tax=Amphimedon queenslandica TaxID=400682 RepID=A0A1X7SU86_AMPQE|nr:PREDICTED: uncharacterized protein LOC109591431 [Amphimedon queenslandica]|eukprot:XP_019862724.1 PREDICTED: uncharacterized protein LOC109591431 [Amphimedon queenslandica]
MVDTSALIPPAGLVPDRLDLLNDSLTDKQLLCIEYVCEFGLGINKELVASAKDQWGQLIFNLLYNVLTQQFSDAPSLLRLILSILRYGTRNEDIEKPNEEAIIIYDKYPNFDMWLTLTVAMTSMKDSDYEVLKDHLRLNVLTGYSDTGITSPCHLLELMKNQPEPHGFDSESLDNVLKWFRECGLKYPKEIVDYQKRHNQQVPTHWEICCKRICCFSFCLSIVAIVTFIPILILLTLPNYPHVTINDSYSQNHSVGVRTVVKIGEVYRSNAVQKLQIEALQNADGFRANGTVIHQVQRNGFNMSSKELQHVNRPFNFTDERPIFLRYYDVSSPLYNADGPGVVNFSFNLTNSNGGDCAVRMATFISHDDFANYFDATPYKLPSDIPQNAYNFTPCLNESGTYNFSLNMKRDAFSFPFRHFARNECTFNCQYFRIYFRVFDT